MRKTLRKLVLRLAELLAEEPAAKSGVRLQASEKAPALRDPVVAQIGGLAPAADVWPSVSIGFEWHDAPVRARDSGPGGVYL